MQVHRVNNLIPYIPETEVGTDQWKMSKYGILTSLGSFTCTLMVAHLPEQRLGYIGHFSSLSNTKYQHALVARQRFDRLISSLRRHNDGTLDIWLGAGVADRYREILDDRAYMEDKLAGLDTRSFTADWADETVSTTALLDCRGGDLLLEVEPASYADD